MSPVATTREQAPVVALQQAVGGGQGLGVQVPCIQVLPDMQEKWLMN
jgi:hypothetical protein